MGQRRGELAGGRRMAEARSPGLRTLYYVAALLLAALVPMILFAGLWFRSELRKSEQEFEAHLESRASALSQRLDSVLQQHVAALQAVAALPSLDEPNLVYFSAVAGRITPAMGWAALGLYDGDHGRQLLNTLRPVGAELPSAPTELLGRVIGGRRVAIDTRDPDAGSLSPEPVIELYVPVIRDGAVRHVLSASLKLSIVQDLLAAEIGDSRLLGALVDERGRLLARSGEPGRSEAPKRSGALALAHPAAFDDEAIERAVQRSPLTGWLSVVGADPQLFSQISKQSNWAVAGTGALSLTLAGILAIFLLYNLMESRLSQERLAASAALGDLDARLLATTQEALGEQRKAASEREVLLREIYHRVKNNLQIVQSLLRLGSRDLAPGQREPFEDAIRRIGAMARVHTLLYNSPDLASIDFADYLHGLVSETAQASGAEQRGIRTIVDAAPMRVSLETAVPLAFIAVELLTNAFKHAFPTGGGTITVTAAREGGSGVLTISDDGVGVPETLRGRALGLTIVAKLVNQIGGSFERPQPGRATFRITFPLEGETNAEGGAERALPQAV